MLQRYTFFLCTVAIFACGPASGQLQSPAEFLPHPYMKEFTPHHLLVEYFEYVASTSPYVTLEYLGETYERRPMFLAIVTAPENMENLEYYRMNNLRLAGLQPGNAEPADAKAIVWLGYSVHGNEAAGSEASMQVVHDLAIGKQGTHEWLKNTIVILEPCENPDGYNRYTNWNNQVSAFPFNISPDAREHHEPWPGGRTNHYLFDLNRDWAWQTQLESQQRVEAYRRWMPHVVADLHEMGHTSPYFFAPAAQPYHEFITEWQRDFQVAIGKNHAKYFDKEGWSYFTKEIFDLFYPSYGDTYPVYNGAIGMTYEQGGSGFAGRAILLPNQDTLSLEDRIVHHRTTSLSTIEITSMQASRVITGFIEYFRKSRTSPPGKYKTYVVRASNPAGKLRALCTFLDRQGIVYGKSNTSSRTLTGLNYTDGSEVTFSPMEDDLVISAFQSQGILTQILFDPESRLVDSVTYDITCWSLPFAYGLEAYATEGGLDVIPGYAFDTIQTRGISGNAYAYALRWDSPQSGKFLAATLKAGLQGRFAENAFAAEGQQYKAGTVLFLRNDHQHNPDFHHIIRSISQELQVPVSAIGTGLVELGRDFGSDAYRLMTAPRVLTFCGDGISPNALGQVWHFFEQELEYPLTIIQLDNLQSVAWDNYDVLIMPEGYYTIPEEKMKAVTDWIRHGGKVIAIGSALSNFRDKEGFALKRYAESSKAEEVKKAQEKDRLHLRLEAYGSDERRLISSQIHGTVFRAKVDEFHPLGFGLGSYYYTLKTGAGSYEHLVDADNAIYLEDELRYFGFAGYKALEQQKNSVIAAMERQGRGTIVYFVDNPLFRAFWEQGKLVFCNALFFAGN